MGLFEFVAERQLIFHADIDGLQRLIIFGEREGNGASVFQTKDERVANAIRRTAMFRRGVIIETTRPTRPQGPKTNHSSPLQKAPTKEEKTFANITQAKDWISRSWGISKSALRAPAQIMAAADAHGVKIIIKAIEA